MKLAPRDDLRSLFRELRLGSSIFCGFHLIAGIAHPDLQVAYLPSFERLL